MPDFRGICFFWFPFDPGSRHRVTGRVELGVVKVNGEVEIVGIHPTTKTGLHGVEMFRKCSMRPGGLQHGACCEHEEGGGGAGSGWRSRLDHASCQFLGQVYVDKEEGGSVTTPFLEHRPQFFFPHDGHHGRDPVAEGTEMVMPGTTTEMTVELIAPIRDGRRGPLRIREAAAPSAPAASPNRQISRGHGGLEGPEDPNSAEGLRPRDHRPIDEEDRRDVVRTRPRSEVRSRCPRRSDGCASFGPRTPDKDSRST